MRTDVKIKGPFLVILEGKTKESNHLQTVYTICELSARITTNTHVSIRVVFFANRLLTPSLLPSNTAAPARRKYTAIRKDAPYTSCNCSCNSLHGAEEAVRKDTPTSLWPGCGQYSLWPQTTSSCWHHAHGALCGTFLSCTFDPRSTMSALP